METTGKIIEIIDNLTTNYKFLFEKLESKKIEELKKKCMEDFKCLKQDISKLMISETAEKELVEVEEKHNKIYNENYFAIESLFENSNKGKTEENIPKKYAKIIRELSEKLEELTIDHENLLKELEINNNSKKIVIKVPNNELEFMKNKYTANIAYNPSRWDSNYFNYSEKMISDAKKYKISSLYLVFAGGSYDWEYGRCSGSFYLHTKQSLLGIYPFLIDKFDEIFYKYFKDNEIKIYIYQIFEENKDLNQQIKSKEEFLKIVASELRSYYYTYYRHDGVGKKINPLFAVYKNE
jgi:hypothetical protein